PFFVERHGELEGILDGAIRINSEVERQNIPGTALQRAREGGHDLAARKIESIQDLVVFQSVGAPHHDHIAHGQLSGGLRDGNRAFLYSHLLAVRSEEHTSELQSRSDLVCRLLLEKKKK